MKPARIVTLLVAAVAVVLVVIVISGGSSNPTYVMTFETAGQLVNDNDVQVGGRRVGVITSYSIHYTKLYEYGLLTPARWASCRTDTWADSRWVLRNELV